MKRLVMPLLLALALLSGDCEAACMIDGNHLLFVNLFLLEELLGPATPLEDECASTRSSEREQLRSDNRNENVEDHKCKESTEVPPQMASGITKRSLNIRSSRDRSRVWWGSSESTTLERSIDSRTLRYELERVTLHIASSEFITQGSLERV